MPSTAWSSEDLASELPFDAMERRNPVSLYVYVNGSAPADWNLRAGAHTLDRWD